MREVESVSSIPPTDEENGAEILWRWFQAYQAVGFTREEALAILNRPVVQFSSPPEFSEMAAKVSRVYDGLLMEDSDGI